jgi:hypothetical protein
MFTIDLRIEEAGISSGRVRFGENRFGEALAARRLIFYSPWYWISVVIGVGDKTFS